MKRLTTLLSAAIAVASVLLLGGCHALSRGDVGRHMDNELAFSKIGFLMTDGGNAALLYRNAVVDVHSDDTYIEITIPYYVDQAGTTPLVPMTGSELTLTFETVAKNAQVYNTNDLSTPISPGVSAFAFHDGTGPITQSFVIRKIDPSTGSVNERTFVIDVNKEFYPVVELIDNPGFTAPPTEPAAIAVHFEDELGNLILMDTAVNVPQDGFSSSDQIWLDDGDGIDEDVSKKNITADFSAWDLATVANTALAPARPLAQGAFYLTIPDNTADFSFVDQHGYRNILQNRTFDVFWDPDAVYMAEWGSSGASGLSAADPVPTLGEAMTVAAGSSRWEIRVAEGDYDLGTGETVDANISIYGGYHTDFSDRYDMEDADIRTVHASLFHGVPAAGSDVSDINGVLTYDPGAGTINDSSILDGLVIAAASEAEGGGNWNTALKITNDASPMIRYCTLVGGGGTSITGASGATVTSCTGYPEFNWNVILATQTQTDGVNAGIFAYDTTTFLVGSGNHIRSVQSLSDSSYGVRLAGGANALLHYNDIASAQANIESVGISAVASIYLMYNANLIASGDAAVQSVGLGFMSINGPAYVYKNTVRSGAGPVSSGIETMGGGGGTIEIANNAIQVGNGATETHGLHISTFAPGRLIFANNLVDSTSSTLIGYASDVNINGDINFPIENNAFDDASGQVEMLIDGSTTDILRTVQNGGLNLYGNIVKAFAFDASGRISSGLDANLAYGGQDGSVYSPEAASLNSYDWNDDPRSLDFTSCGWSIGPYEFDGVAHPAAVHVTMSSSSNPGSDKFPLGTSEYPFAGLQRAYDEIDGRPVASKEIRVAQGNYTVATTITMDSDLVIRGGWTESFSSRSTNASLTRLTAADATLFVIDGNDDTGISSNFLMAGFTFLSSFAANSTLLLVRDFASPEILNNVFDGTAVSPASSCLLQIESYSSPDVHNNDFIGGSPGGNDVGIYTTNFAYPNIYDNTITGGSPTGGASINILSDTYAYPNIYDNDITGGSPTAGDALCLRLIDCSYATVRDNNIDGGTPSTGASVMMEISGSSTPNVYGNDLDGPSISGSVTGIAILSNADPTISNNDIFSGDSGANVLGILVQDSGTSPTIQGNTIVAGDPGSGNASTAIAVMIDASPVISGNVLTGGPGDDSVVVDIDSTSGTVVDGNTITLGTAVDDVSGIAVANGSHTVTNNVIGGGTAGDTITGIFVSSASGTNVTGNTVSLGNGDSTIGVMVQNSVGVTIEDTDVTGGSAATSLYGIRLSNTSNGTVRNCDIDIAGSAPLPVSFGLHSLTGPGLVVEYNSISGGAGITAHGVYIMNGNVIYITDNIIAGTSVGTTSTTMSTGLYLSGTSQTSILRNSIHAGEAAGTTVGIDVVTPNITCVTNNLVHGGGLVTGTATGIRLTDGDNVSVLFNNTVYAGRSSASWSLGVHLAGTAQPRMANNLIIAGSGFPISDCIGVRQESPNIPPLFLTNIIVGTNPTTVAYRDDGSNDWRTADEIQAHFVANFGGPPNHVVTAMADTGVNLTDEHPSVYLRDFTANGGITAFFGDDWRLSGGGQQDAVTGGSDLSGYGAPYGLNDDHNGAARTIPWSIGAYEY